MTGDTNFSSGSNQVRIDALNGGIRITKSNSGAFIDLSNTTDDTPDVRLMEFLGGLDISTTSGGLSVNSNAVYHTGNLNDETFTAAVEDTVGRMLAEQHENGVVTKMVRGHLVIGIRGGAGSNLDADRIDGHDTAKAATGNTVVVREVSGAINATQMMLSSGAPLVTYQASSAKPNMGRWQLGADHASFFLRSTDDANKSSIDLLSFTRDENTISARDMRVAVSDNVYVTTNGASHAVLHTGNLSEQSIRQQIEGVTANLILNGNHTNVSVSHCSETNSLSFSVNTDDLRVNTLDGYDAWSFPRKTEHATITGDWRFSGEVGVDTGKAIWFGHNPGTDDFGFISWREDDTYAIPDTEAHSGYLSIKTATDAEEGTNSIALEPSADLFLAPGGGLYFGTASKRKIIWHEGNDGASSGLDADLLDGFHASILAMPNTAAVRDKSNTIFASVFNGTATSARYADLAERYWADSAYEPGTVVVFGGEHEITVSRKSHDTAVAGVISTDPAFMMNSDAGESSTHPYVALAGRVPCKVVGPIKKGELLTTSEITGHAKRMTTAIMGSIVGKALEDFTGQRGVIEISIQRS